MSDDDLLETLLHGEREAARQRRTAEQQRQVAEGQRRALEELQRETAAAQRQVGDDLRRLHARPLRPRRAQQRALAAIRTGYEFGGLLLAELAALAIWLVFWCANGFFTALFVQALARQASAGLNRFIALHITPDVQLSLGLESAWVLGVLAHLVITLIELHLWRSGRRGTYPLIIAVGVFDVYTSAVGLQALGAAWALPTRPLLAVTSYVVLAELIAILPERRIVDHASAIVLMLRRRPTPAPTGG